MRRLLCLIFGFAFCITAFAHTIEWYVDGTLYHTTTCASGDNITPPTPPAKTGYHFDSWAVRLPAGYTELEYIESTGTQYINTGIVPTIGTHAEIKFAYMSISGYGYAFGNQEVDGHYFGLRLNNSGKLQFLAGGSGIDLDITAVSGTIFTAELSVSGTSATYTINGVSNTETIQFSSVPGTRHIGVFANGDGEYVFRASARCYGFSVDNNGTMIRNMVPAKNSSGVVGMYDTVSGTFFTNAGTGVFIAGPVAQ